MGAGGGSRWWEQVVGAGGRGVGGVEGGVEGGMVIQPPLHAHHMHAHRTHAHCEHACTSRARLPRRRGGGRFRVSAAPWDLRVRKRCGIRCHIGGSCRGCEGVKRGGVFGGACCEVVAWRGAHQLQGPVGRHACEKVAQIVNPTGEGGCMQGPPLIPLMRCGQCGSTDPRAHLLSPLTGCGQSQPHEIT